MWQRRECSRRYRAQQPPWSVPLERRATLLQSLAQAVGAPFQDLLMHAWAQRHGLAALTLTTFTDVP
jgi:hypothetical protein